jgi:hypothetical protein
MGFWQTGYMEFRDGDSGWCDGYAPGVPPRWYGRCETCLQEFTSPESLTLHSIEAHPRCEPRVCIRGIELGSTTYNVRAPLRVADIVFANDGKLAINGVHATPREAKEAICAAVQRTFDLTLDGGGFSRSFRINVRIPSQPDLAGVERCLDALVRGGSLGRSGIDRFIRESSDFSTASDYAGGIVAYLYGVLARERSNETHLHFDEHEERFSKAANCLADLPRSLAHCLRSIISFAGNHFQQAALTSPDSRIGAAAATIASSIDSARRIERTWPASYNADEDRLFTDIDTERIVRWALMPALARHEHSAEMQAAFDSMPSSFDRTKAAILIATAADAAGDKPTARRFARHLRESPVFDAWADELLKQL